jgi:peroxiredoxin
MNHFLFGLRFLVAALFLHLSSNFVEAQVQIQGQLTDCQTDSLLFFELDGVSLRPLAVLPLQKDENGLASFSVKIEAVQPGFYFLGAGKPADTRMMMLGPDPLVQLSGTCPQLAKASISQSPLNQSLQLVTQEADQYAKEFQQQIRQYQIALRTKANVLEIEQQMRLTDQKKLSLYDSLSVHQPLLASIIGLRTYLSYQNHGQGFPSESRYFAEQYFRFADFSDPFLDRLPQLHEQVRIYATTLGSLELTTEQQLSYGQQLLGKLPGMSRAYKSGLLGLVMGFRGKNDLAFVTFAEEYLRDFPQDNPGLAAQLSAQITQARAKMIGAVAPEISLPNPEGDTLRLSDLRGKVVLLDFWASWCGPCRKENPNVVRIYEKYKDQGFEILGVSLDRSKASWVQAIEKDGLKWLHVSDLKQWRSIAAQTYGVGAIPYTVLLDQEGKIVAKKLRGRQLEQAVARLLSEENPMPIDLP